MPTRFSRWLLLLAVVAVSATPASADLYGKAQTPTEPTPLPKPTDLQSLTVYPTNLTIRGTDDAAQLIVTATLKDGRLQDLSGDVEYAVADGKTARVLPTGRVLPLANGATQIVARFGDKTVSIPLTVKHADENLPINFPNQVVPVFTKLGCNSGGCHGKASGQNGFKLSLLGYEPDVDYAALVLEARGRRLMPAAPDSSLLLLKATGAVPHGGGKKMERDSDEYRLVRRWVAAGTPFGKDTDPIVTKISVSPDHRVMTRQNKQQFVAYAHYSDGTIEDITRRAQYGSTEREIGAVDANGVVRTLSLSGEAAIMARYQGHVAVFRATVPLGTKTPDWQFPAQTVVDRYTSQKWKDLGLVPSDLAADEAFVRRAYLDLTGTLPTPKEVVDFAADKDPKKREALIDRLVESPEYSFFFANKWADILRVKRGREGNAMQRAQGTFAFHNWIREAIANDKPYDEFVRDILAAIGDESKAPPTVWYRDLQKAEQFVDDACQLFLGVRVACAQCHHHPYEKWSQDDYWGMAAFFAQIGRKQAPNLGIQVNNPQQARQIIFNRGTGTVNNNRTGKVAVMKAIWRAC